MTPVKQARISFKTRLAAREWTVKKLAKEAGHTREAVSRAINRGTNPGVLKRVKEILGV